jgi:hypothetical protein
VNVCSLVFPKVLIEKVRGLVFFQRKQRLLAGCRSPFPLVDMSNLICLVHLSRVGFLGTLKFMLLSEYILMATFGTLALLFVATQFNFYKIGMILKRFNRNTRKLCFGNKLKLRTGYRCYRNSKLKTVSEYVANEVAAQKK